MTKQGSEEKSAQNISFSVASIRFEPIMNSINDDPAFIWNAVSMPLFLGTTFVYFAIDSWTHMHIYSKKFNAICSYAHTW